MRTLKQAHQKSPFSVEIRDYHCDHDTFAEINGTDGNPCRFDTVGDAINWVMEGGDWEFNVFDCDHISVCVGHTRT